MRTLRVKKPGGLDHLQLDDTNAAEPGPGEIRVRWRASSLNYHDLLVANGGLSVADGRIPMSDGAGEVDALGAGVSRWAVGDQVMSLFFPNWQEGRHRPEHTRAVTGDSIDGCACEYAVISENAVTRMPRGLSFAEAATLPSFLHTRNHCHRIRQAELRGVHGIRFTCHPCRCRDLQDQRVLSDHDAARKSNCCHPAF